MKTGPSRAAFDLVRVIEKTNEIKESNKDRKLQQNQKMHLALNREELLSRKKLVQLKEEELKIRKKQLVLKTEKPRLQTE